MVYKNVYFHQLHLYKVENDSKKQSSKKGDKLYQTSSLLNEKFQHIINRELNEHKCIRITEEDNGKSEVLEIIKEDEDYIFARLGRMRDIHQFHLRNTKTFKPDPIDKNDDQEIEIFTYLLIDRKDFIISYLKEQSAPSIQRLGNVITQVFKSNGFFGEISSITIEDALPLISKKDEIGTINYRVSIPPEGSKYFNQEYTGLTEKEYEQLSNQKSIEFEIKLVANRSKDSFEGNRNGFSDIIKKITRFAKSVKVKAKNKDEYMQEYKIVDSPFTKRQKFVFDSTAESISGEIFTQLRYVYQTNKKEIEQFYRKTI